MDNGINKISAYGDSILKGAVTGTEITIQVFGRGVGLCLQPGLYRGVKIIGNEHRKQRGSQKQHQQYHAHIVEEPAAFDAAFQAQAGHQTFFCTFRLVFCHDGHTSYLLHQPFIKSPSGGGSISLPTCSRSPTP